MQRPVFMKRVANQFQVLLIIGSEGEKEKFIFLFQPSEPISSFTYNWQRGSFSPLCKTLKIKIKTLSRSWMKISDHNVYQSGGGLNNKNGL